MGIIDLLNYSNFNIIISFFKTLSLISLYSSNGFEVNFPARYIDCPTHGKKEFVQHNHI